MLIRLAPLRRPRVRDHALMELWIDLPDHMPGEGQRYSWDDGYVLRVNRDAVGEAVVSGNAAGLRSLARHLLVLAQEDVRPGSHLHLDMWSGLDDGSDGLVIAREA
jgi:hypothetical protein